MPTNIQNFISKLREHLNAARVLDDPDTLNEAADDWTEITGHPPEVIVKAKTVAEIQIVLKMASAERVPVTPRVANMNIGGLAITEKGGILLDLTEMNQIVEINEADMYAVIEPGVTWGDMKKRLQENHPGLRFGYSLSPPYTSVLANCLMDGLTNLGLKHGATAQWVNGVEVVLPNGEIVRTGIGAVSRYWCSAAPMPNLTGLFTNFHGTTGIVTKVAVQLWPNHPFRQRFFVLTYDTNTTYDLIAELTRAEVCDDIGGLSWPVAKMLFGESRPLYRDPNEPQQFLYIDVSAEHKILFKAKLKIINELIAAKRRTGARLEAPLEISKLVGIAPRFEKFADFPTELDFLLAQGGLSWVGTFGPTSRWKDGVDRGMEIMQQAGFPPIVVTRPMQGGHFGVLRFIEVFDKTNPDEVRKVKELNEELSDLVIELGFFPYKTPPWVIKRHRDKIDKGFLNLLNNVRKLLDPEGIMNPGKWPY